MRTINKSILLVLVCLLMRVDLVFGQASVANAEVRGQVTDAQGAAVVGATITLTDVAKGTTRTVTSDENGNYVILSLLPSTYTARVEASGFATKTITNLKLEVGQVASLPVELAVGGVAAEVNIAANNEIVEVERTQQSTVINEKQITNLPINRRNYLDFALLTPGVTDSDNINDSSDFRVAQTPQSGLSFGGNNGRGNSIMVDGASADTNSGAAREVISQEGVQEFQVNRNSYSAEYGGASGGIVNIVSKTGSNDFHGSVFGYFRDEIFDARNAFDFNPDGKSEFNRQQYGGSIGGPIKSDKTFFFAAFERLDQAQTSFVNLLNDPTIFLLSPNSTNPLVRSQDALFTFLGPTPFAPLATALRTSLTTTNFPRTVNLFEEASGQFPFDAFDTVISGRIDHTFSDKDSGYIRLNWNRNDAENQAAGALTAVSRGREFNTLSGGILLSETHFFSPTTINEFKAQWTYANNDVLTNDPIGPEFNIEGYGNFGRDIFLPARAYERRYEFADNLSLVRGTHTYKLGGIYQAIYNASVSETFFGGRFNFGTAIALANLIPAATRTPLNAFLRECDPAVTPNTPPPAYCGSTGAALGADANQNNLADSLDAPITSLQSFNLNLPIVYQQGFGDPLFKSWSHRSAFYVQDIWKVRPNFTFNYGLRYYLENNADPMPTYKKNFQPRLGFSWDPWGDGRTAIRGGYGLYVGQIDNQIVNVVNELSGMGDPSNINIVLATATSAGLGVPASTTIYQTLLAQGVIGTRTIQASDLAQFGIVPAPGRPLEVRFRVGENYRNPYTQQASLAVQRDLGGTLNVEVSYLFNRGTHIPRNRDTNQFKVSGPINPISFQQCFSRFPGVAYSGNFCPGIQPSPSDFRNPLIFQDNVYESTANSFYHAGTIQLSKRFSDRFAINSNYTLSKTIDEVTDFNSDWSAQNPLNVRADRALSAFDQRHRFVFAGVFSGPVNDDSVITRIFSNWVVSPIFIAGSGRPFNLLLGFDANNDGRSQSDRPAGAGRNTGRGEPYYNMDLRLARRFAVGEGKYFEFTAEAFNLFNVTNYTGINNIVGVTRLETIDARGIDGLAPTQPLGFTSAAPKRQLQFGARFNF